MTQISLQFSCMGYSVNGYCSHNLNDEIKESFCDKRFSERLSFASFARAGNDQLLSELEVSAIKPKQNEGSERLAVAEGFLDFVL